MARKKTPPEPTPDFQVEDFDLGSLPEPLDNKDLRAESALLFGDIGSGKTRFLAEALEAGEKILLLHLGLGRSGAFTIKSYLKAKKKLKLIENLKVITLNSWKHTEVLRLRGWEAVVDKIEDFTPTIVAYEEINGLQSRYGIHSVGDSFDPHGGEMFGYYRSLKAYSEEMIRLLLSLPPPDVFTIMTAHEKRRSVEAAGSTNKKEMSAPDSGGLTPAIDGAALKGICGAYDFVILFVLVENQYDADEHGYWYETQKDMANVMAKCRGEGWPDRFRADGKALLSVMKGDKEPSSLSTTKS